MITKIPNLLESAEYIKDLLIECDWKEGLSNNQQYKEQVKQNLELRQNDCTEAYKGVKIVCTALDKNETYQKTALPYKIVTPRFNCCTNGGRYGEHADAAIMNKPPIRSDLSMTIFLSSPEEYEGGELEIIDADGTINTFKEPAGTAILYPSYFVHQVHPVTAGKRICAILWIQSIIRDETKRSLLTRMLKFGEQIQKDYKYTYMTAEYSSIYNNLLRQWAENG